MEQITALHLIGLIWRNKFLFLSTIGLVGIVSSLFLFLQPNYFKASTTFYPVHGTLLEPYKASSSQGPFYYGDDKDVDRLLSIGNSNEIVNSIIDEFNLAAHYQIDNSNNKGQLKLIKRFGKLFNIQKTEFDAIELSMEDQDPEIAQQLVIAIRSQINDDALDIIHDSQKRLLVNYKKSININRDKIKIVSDSLTQLRNKFGIYDTETQPEALASLEVNSPRNIQLQRQIDGFRKGISAVRKLESLEWLLNNEMNSLALKIQQLETFLETDKSAIHLIEEASIPLEKSRPKRFLILAASLILSSMTLFLLLLAKEQFSRHDKA